MASDRQDAICLLQVEVIDAEGEYTVWAWVRTGYKAEEPVYGKTLVGITCDERILPKLVSTALDRILQDSQAERSGAADSGA